MCNSGEMRVLVKPTTKKEADPGNGTVLSALAQRFPLLVSFSIRDYRWYWVSSFASSMAMTMLMITRGWLVLRLTDDSPMKLALVLVSMALPMASVSLIGGVFADRVSRRRLLVLGQGCNAFLTLVVATLDYTGLIVFSHLLITGFLNGILMAMIMPSRSAMVSDIVPEDKLMNGIALANSGWNLSSIIGPAVAGILIIYLGTAGVFYLIVGLYVISSLTIFMVIDGSRGSVPPKSGVANDIRDGMRYVASNSNLLGLMIIAFLTAMFGMTYHVLLPAWAREALNVQSDGLGVLMMTMGLGSLLGTVVLASLGNIKRRGDLLILSCVLWGVALAIFSQTTSYQFAIPLLLLIGIVTAIFRALNMTLMQLNASPEMRGRVMSMAMMTFGIMPLSALPFGAISEFWGTPNALLISGALLALLTVIFTFRYPSFRSTV